MSKNSFWYDLAKAHFRAMFHEKSYGNDPQVTAIGVLQILIFILFVPVLFIIAVAFVQWSLPSLEVMRFCLIPISLQTLMSTCIHKWYKNSDTDSEED